MSIWYFSSSKRATDNMKLIDVSEPPRVSGKGVYVGRTMVYKMPFFLDDDELLNPHMAVLGMTGSGKSYFLKNYLIRSRLVNESGILILDWNGEYDELVRFLDGRVVDASGDAILNINPEHLNSVLSINMSGLNDDAKRKEAAFRILNSLIELMHRLEIGSGKKRLVVLDEAWKLINDGKILGQLFREGRKYGFGVIVATQLVGDVNNEIISNAACIAIFRMQNGGDYSALVENGIIKEDDRHRLSSLRIGSCMFRLAYKNSAATPANFIIKKIDGLILSTYTIWWGKMQVKISFDNFRKITDQSIQSVELRARLEDFLEANKRNVEFGALMGFLVKNRMKREEIVPYARLLGFNDLQIANAYENSKGIVSLAGH